MFKIRPELLGCICRAYRIESLKMTQVEVAKETGYTASNINKFELGKTSSVILLCYYMSKGLSSDEILKAVEGE